MALSVARGREAVPAPVALSRPELLVVLRRADGSAAGAAADTLLREVLTELTGTPPAAHVFDRTCQRCCDPSHGKPVLQHPSLHTSRSYTDGLLAVAVSAAGPVGVDVEQVRGTAFDGFAEVALAPAERDGNPSGRARAWTRKEAVLKARGTGLTIDPRTVDVRRDRVRGRPPVHLFDIGTTDDIACAAAVLSLLRPRLRLELSDVSGPAAAAPARAPTSAAAPPPAHPPAP